MQHSENSIDNIWHCQLTQWHLRKQYQTLRRNAAIGFFTWREQRPSLVELGRLILVVVHDERLPNGRLVIRVSGFKPNINRHGVTWASRENAVIYKDLRLKPCRNATGPQFDIRQQRLLRLALQLNEQLELTDGVHLGNTLSALIFPRLWAGFSSQVARSIVASGPEFEEHCKKLPLSPSAIQSTFTRHHLDRTLLPLEWVSDKLGQSTGLYAELDGVPPCQIVSPDRHGNLRGYDGATEYDLFASRLRDIQRQPTNTPCQTSIIQGVN